MTTFNGKVALITGGASGIGREIAEQLFRQGAKVIVADLNIEAVQNNAGKIKAVQVDVAQASQVQSVVEQVVKEFGRIDYLFNNAGFAIAGEVANMTTEQWDRIIDVNLKGVVNGVMAAYPIMIKQGGGHIVNTASLAGLSTAPVLTAYSTTKHAIVGLSSGLRVEAAKYKVKVTVLCPGFIKTGIYDNGVYLKSSKDDMLGIIPFKLLEVDQSVEIILKGVARNKGIIVFPFYGKLQWGIERLSPALGRLLGHKLIADFRKRQARNK